MPLKIEKCNDGDMTRAFAIISAAFGHNPYMDVLYPGHDTPQGHEAGGERMLAFKKSDPNTHFIKAIDTENGDIVGVAKWNIYNGTIPEEVGLDGDYWATEEDKEYANCLWTSYLGPRRKAIKDSKGHLVCESCRRSRYLEDTVNTQLMIANWTAMDILTVDPEMQSRGAGRKLLEWGTNEADRLGFSVRPILDCICNGREVVADVSLARPWWRPPRMQDISTKPADFSINTDTPHYYLPNSPIGANSPSIGW